MKEKLISALQQKPYFLVLLPVFFIIHGYNDFFGFFPLQFVFYNFIATLLTTFILFIVSVPFFKMKQKRYLYTFWLLLIVLIFGSFHDALKKTFHQGFFSSYKFILSLLLLFFLLLLLYLKKSNSHFLHSFQFLNLLFLLLLLVELITGFMNFNQYQKGSNLLDNRFTIYNSYKPQAKVPDSEKPDIYFLVFDGMPSTKAMQSYWNFNNAKLDSFLQEENFFISENSKSNYNLTVLSLSSTLNMDYTPPIDLSQNEVKMYFKASSSILNNSLTKILTKEGYQISQYQPVSFGNKDWDGSLFFKEMLYMNYFYKTLPGRLYRDLGWHFSSFKFKFINKFYESKFEKRNIIAEKDIEHLLNLVKNSCVKTNAKPKFVYAHFVLPHDPFIFDSTGKRKETRLTIQLSEKEQVTAFIEQVKYVNKVIEQLVKHIKQNNKTNTIILLEGDHGYRNIYGQKGYMTFENLNAFYLPGKDSEKLYSSISPVNSFRIILNKYFSANLPLLKDSSIFIPYTLPGEK